MFYYLSEDSLPTSLAPPAEFFFFDKALGPCHYLDSFLLSWQSMLMKKLIKNTIHSIIYVSFEWDCSQSIGHAYLSSSL